MSIKSRRQVGHRVYTGQLEIHADRGVIYFHVTDPKQMEELGGVTLLRICNLPTPIPEMCLDITHMHGADWEQHPGETKDGRE